MAISPNVATGKKDSSILVTGAAGFIGFHLSERLLKDGHRVVGVDNMSDYYDIRIKQKRLEILGAYPSFSFHQLDIADYEKLESLMKTEAFNEVVHLAAQAGVRYSLTNPWVYEHANGLGTMNVFEAAKRLKLPRVLYASSSSVYGSNTKSPMSEEDRTDSQISVYAASKKANESLAHAYNHLYGIELIGLRFFTVYGTWGRPDLALFKFTKNILAGLPIDVYNNGEMKRSFTHVSDITAGIAALIARAPEGRNEIYNLGGAEPMPLLDFIALIEKELGKTATKNMLPMQAGDVPETVADWSKAHRDVGFTPSTSMETGIKDFIAWFRENEPFLLTLTEPKQ